MITVNSLDFLSEDYTCVFCDSSRINVEKCCENGCYARLVCRNCEHFLKNIDKSEYRYAIRKFG